MTCISFRLSSDRQRVLIEVWDADPHPPTPVTPDANTESGRGLLLVEALSDRWGYYHPDRSTQSARAGAGDSWQLITTPRYPPAQWSAGKVVWCEVTLRSQPEPTATTGISITGKGI